MTDSSDPDLAGGGVKRLYKSRYSSVSRFIGKAESPEELVALNQLNDIDANIDEEAYKMLIDGGFDESLASHIAHLFVRDPLVIFDDAVVLDDTQAMDHFENIQSTNWRTMRWKSPSLEMGIEADRRKKIKESKEIFNMKNKDLKVDDVLDANKEDGNSEKSLYSFGPGWRVEFRPLEIQLTDFENAAFAILTVLTTRSLLAMGYNFYIPVSLVEENMHRAQKQDAVLKEKFWVGKKSFSPSLTNVKGKDKDGLEGGGDGGSVRYASGNHSLIPDLKDITPIELNLDEFFNGRQGTAIDRAAGRQGEGFPGLIPAIYGYLEALGCDSLMIGRLRPYLTLLQKRASGELPTAAHWIRTFVRGHQDYTGEGIVTPAIADDLLMLLDDLGMGRVQCPDLLGDALVETLCSEEESDQYLSSLVDKEKTSKNKTNRTRIIPSNISLTENENIDKSGTTKIVRNVRKVKCASYTPISVCSSSISCNEGKLNENVTEAATQIPWIANVLMGSGCEPDTYLDISLIQ